MPLICAPVSSIFNRRHEPAPISTVHTQLEAANCPIIVLLLPIVIAQPAQHPIPMLLDPIVTPYSAFIPTAVLSHPVVFAINAQAPTAVLLDAPYLLL